MQRTNRSRRPTPRSTRIEVGADSRFPRAVFGEEYERFARAMWRQGERWYRRHAHVAADPNLPSGDSRTILASLAEADLGRALYSQEQNLLSELLQRFSDDAAKMNDRTTPEIPSFLLD